MIDIEHGRQAAEVGGRAAGRAGGDASTLRSESDIPRRSFRSCAAGYSYVAAEIVLPLVLAVILKLLLQPAMRILERWHVPRMLAALLLILAVFGTIVGLGTAIAGPASTWAAKLPEGIPRLQERLSFLQAPSTRCNGFYSRWRTMDNRQGRRRGLG